MRKGCAAGVGLRPSAAGSGPAAHRGPDRRCRAGVTDSRCSCAADGGPTVVVSHGSRFLRSRAGCRIEVHKISTPSPCSRTVLSVPQTAEQLVEVPTIISFSSLQRIVEQAVGGGGGGGLYGLHPGQSSTAFVEAGPHIPAATAEQIVVIPVPRGAPHDFHQDPLRAAGSTGLPGTANQGVFRTFPRPKKSAKVRARSRSELAAHSSSSTPSAYGVVSSLEEKKEEHQVSPMPDSIDWVESLPSDCPEDATWLGERDEEGGIWYWHRRFLLGAISGDLDRCLRAA